MNPFHNSPDNSFYLKQISYPTLSIDFHAFINMIIPNSKSEENEIL